jgi:hypothetical protein
MVCASEGGRGVTGAWSRPTRMITQPRAPEAARLAAKDTAGQLPPIRTTATKHRLILATCATINDAIRVYSGATSAASISSGRFEARARRLARLRGFAPRMPDFALDWHR